MQKLHNASGSEYKKWCEDLDALRQESLSAVRAETPKYEQHPVAKILPPLGKKQAKALERAVSFNQASTEIILHEGMVLDGWDIYLACWALGKEPYCKALPNGEDPMTYIRDKYKSWRGLNSWQRTVCAAKEYLLLKGHDQPIGGNLVKEIALSWGESERSVGRVLRAKRHLLPQAWEEMEMGRKCPYWGECMSKLSPEEQLSKLQNLPAKRNTSSNPLASFEMPHRIEIVLTARQMQETQERMRLAGYTDTGLFIQHVYINALTPKGL